VVIAALEDAYAAAAKRVLHSQEVFVCHLDRDTGEFTIATVKRVVEESEVENPLIEMSLEEAQTYRKDVLPGDILEFPQETPPNMGRIAAQQAKQVLTQKIREAEREIIYKEYKDRVGTIINGVVKRIEKRSIIVDIGRTEALLPPSEQSRGERFLQNDRVRALIVEVKENAKGNQIILSRARGEFVMRLFEAEVPEIYDGTVSIRAVAREAGERTKIAVVSKDRDVDPIGACIGMRGMRVQAVTRELRGEKIDIIPYKEDLQDLVKAALAPAMVTRVQIVDQEAHRMEVVVPEDQISLTIGKRGQNIRLAGQLVGWELDVKSEEVKKQEILAAMSSMMGSSEEYDETSEEAPPGDEPSEMQEDGSSEDAETSGSEPGPDDGTGTEAGDETPEEGDEAPAEVKAPSDGQGEV
jgi:N utilization substance protein A